MKIVTKLGVITLLVPMITFNNCKLQESSISNEVNDDNGVMNKSLLDVKGDILSISQFTLYADTSKGRRPSYVNANGNAKPLYDEFNNKLRAYTKVETGIFGSDMEVSLINDGPVTIILEYGD